jgi:hypothetical protein
VRAHDEIARVREEKQGEGLLEQLLWRIEILGGDVDLIDRQNRAAFSEVLDAYAPENHRLVLPAAEDCRARRANNEADIRFTGVLISGEILTAELDRHLDLGRRIAHHRRFRVAAAYRGNRIAPRSLIRSVALYEALGFKQIKLRAAFSGTWYWASWGFRFEVPSELARVQDHAQTIIDAFGGDLDATTLTHPIQFVRLGEPITITFDALCDALPDRRDPYESIAYDNGLGMHDPVPFGRVVLLTAPSWDGCLDLDGPDRLIFNDRAKRVLGAEGGA